MMSVGKKIKKQKKLKQLIIFTILLIIIVSSVLSYITLNNKPRILPQSIKQTVTQLNLPGVYKGDLPCADCPGIKETLTLTATDSAQTTGGYLMEDLYLERNPKPFSTHGLWEIVDTNILKLIPQTSSSQPQFFLVLTNGNLQMLDSNMQKIDSPFNQILTKQK